MRVKLQKLHFRATQLFWLVFHSARYLMQLYLLLSAWQALSLLPGAFVLELAFGYYTFRDYGDFRASFGWKMRYLVLWDVLFVGALIALVAVFGLIPMDFSAFGVGQ